MSVAKTTESPQAYIVTGCAGFIAAQTCHQLLDSGHHVLGIDYLQTTRNPSLKGWRLAQLTARERFHFHSTNVADPHDVTQFTKWARQTQQSHFPDVSLSALFNFAARVGVRESVVDPADYFATNTHGTLHLLDACRTLQIPKFLLASTSSVYGTDTPLPFREDAAADRPISPYAASKRAAELLAYSYHYLYRIDVSVLRFFTVYGPAGRPDMSVFRFVRSLCENEPIKLFGDGEQQRCFTYVDDIAAGVVAAVRPVGYEIINLGGHNQSSVNEMIAVLAQLTGNEPQIVRHPSHPADVFITQADISKAQQLLGWQPQTSLVDGLRQSVLWYQTHRDIARQADLDP